MEFIYIEQNVFSDFLPCPGVVDNDTDAGYPGAPKAVKAMVI